MKYLARLALLLTLLVSVQPLSFVTHAATPLQAPVGGGTATPPELDPAAWKRFTSSAGDFTALFPGTPVEEKQSLPIATQNVLMNMATVRTAAEYSVAYADIPFAVEGTDRVSSFLANVRDAGVKGINGHLVDDKEEPFNGHPGRVYKVEFGGGYYITCRTFVVKSRLYMVGATTYGEKKAPPDVVRVYENAARRFLDSFRLKTIEKEGEQARNTDPASVPSQVGEEGEVESYLKRQRESGRLVLSRCLDSAHCGSGGEMSGTRVVTGGVVEGKTVSKPQPGYPPIARAAHASGTVVVAVVVDEDGKVVAAQALSGHPLLQTAAVQAARGWQFTPTLLDGKPVKVTGTITFNFTLQ